MRAQPPAQRLVQQMRRRVVRADRGAARVVHLGQHGHADARLARLDAAEMHEQIAQLLLRVGHRDAQAIGAGDRAGIADLAAAFAVERRLVQHHGDLGAGGRARSTGAPFTTSATISASAVSVE